MPVAVVGSSLGGAAALLASYRAPPAAMVVESVFADVTTAIDNRLTLRLGPAGRWLTPSLTCQAKPLLGLDLGDLSPLRAIRNVRQPVLILYGSADQHARPAEARALFAAANPPKECWEVPGAAHVDLHHFARAEYEKRVGEFLARHLGRERE